MHDISNLIDKIKQTVETHKIDNKGGYCRWLWQDAENSRRLGINEYGCADAVNILYTIGSLPGLEYRGAYIESLQSLQNPESGLFIEETHTPIHTTAHCTAALELLDAKPKYPFHELKKYLKKDELYKLLDTLDWDNGTWPESHKGAGIYAAFVINGDADIQWQKWYFDWLWNEADSETGMWRKGHMTPYVYEGYTSVFPILAGTFHYMFNHEYAKMPLRYPEKIIDTCLDIYNRNTWPALGKKVHFAEIDWVYCLNRSLRQCNHRFEESKQALQDFADRYILYLESIDTKTDDGFNDLHMLFGAVCALAELQQALPGYIYTEKPLRLVLERRPFI